MNIELHVERLILDGLAVPPRDRINIKAAVEAELARLLTADGLSAALLSGGSVAHLPQSSIQISSDANPTGLGQQIAAAVHGQIGKRD